MILPVLALLLAACTSGKGGGPSSPPSGSPSTPGSPTTGPGTSTPSPTAPPSPTPSQNPAVGFDTMGGDAFSWTVHVVGTAKCHVAAIEVNGRDSGAKIERNGPGFSATVTLEPGTNEVVAKCAASGTGAEASTPIVYDERLVAAPTAHIRV